MRPLFSSALLASLPPWLSRLVGARVVGGIADVVDEHAERVYDGMRQRLPKASRPTALPYLSRDRRIRRGPLEPADTFAKRLVTWWDDHRSRGGPHALLRQFHAYLADYAPGDIDAIYQSGTRFNCAEATGEITRADIAWGGDGEPGPWTDLLSPAALSDTEISVDTSPFPDSGAFDIELFDGVSDPVTYTAEDRGEEEELTLSAPLDRAWPSGTLVRRPSYWARMWIVVSLGNPGTILDEIGTEGGDPITTEGGEPIGALVPVWGGVFDATDESVWTIVPRDWSAAHVQRCTVVILYGTARLWDFPQPVPTFDEDGAARTWDEHVPIQYRIEN